MSSKFSDVLEGAKQGAIKKGIDTAIDKISDPVVVSLKEKLGQNNPMLGDLTEAAVKFIISLGMAEAIAALGPQVGSLIGREGEDAAEKAQLLSTYMRKYAGERLGAEAIEATIVFLPEILSSFKSIKSEDIKHVLGEKSEVITEKFPEVASEIKIESILDKLAQEESETIKQK